MKISKRAQYGLRAMVFLAKSYNGPKGAPKVASTKTISENEGVSFDFLEKIIRQLAEAKLVNGKKGVQGGYSLSRSPKKINANDVVSVLEGRGNSPGYSKKVVDCSLCARKSKCLTKNVWQKVETSLNKTLKSITLADLIK